MIKMVDVEVLRPFNKTAQGDLATVGETFPVDETRADELGRLGLAKRTGSGAKAAPAPENKMAPAPENKRGRPPRLPELNRDAVPRAIVSTRRPPVQPPKGE